MQRYPCRSLTCEVDAWRAIISLVPLRWEPLHIRSICQYFKTSPLPGQARDPGGRWCAVRTVWMYVCTVHMVHTLAVIHVFKPRGVGKFE